MGLCKLMEGQEGGESFHIQIHIYSWLLQLRRIQTKESWEWVTEGPSPGLAQMCARPEEPEAAFI